MAPSAAAFITIIGRITEIGPTYIVLVGTPRLERPGGTFGHGVTVAAVAVDGKYVAQSISLNPDQGTISGDFHSGL